MPGDSISKQVISSIYLLLTLWMQDSPSRVYVTELAAQELKLSTKKTIFYLYKHTSKMTQRRYLEVKESKESEKLDTSKSEVELTVIGKGLYCTNLELLFK